MHELNILPAPVSPNFERVLCLFATVFAHEASGLGTIAPISAVAS